MDVDYNEVVENKVLMMVSNAGAANGKAFEALDAYEKNDMELVNKCLDEATELLSVAHANQSSLMGMELKKGESILSVLLIHAMDICMVAANSIQYTKKLISVFESQKR